MAMRVLHIFLSFFAEMIMKYVHPGALRHPLPGEFQREKQRFVLILFQFCIPWRGPQCGRSGHEKVESAIHTAAAINVQRSLGYRKDGCPCTCFQDCILWRIDVWAVWQRRRRRRRRRCTPAASAELAFRKDELNLWTSKYTQ